MFELSLKAVLDGLLLGSLYAVAALGLSLIFGVLDFINFAHGDFLMLAMYASFWSFVIFGLDPVFSPFLTIPLFFGIGILLYKAMIKRAVKAPQLTQIALTVGLLMTFRGFAQVAWGSHPRAVPTSIVHGVITLGDFSISVSRLSIALVSIGALIVLYYFLTRTYHGLAIRAIVDDRQAAEGVGVDVGRVFALSFGLGIGLAALAGGLFMTFSHVSPVLGLRYGLLVWIVVILAGIGTIRGVLFSGWIIGIIESLTTIFWDPRASMLAIYLLFIAVLWIRPRGLWGVR